MGVSGVHAAIRTSARIEDTRPTSRPLPRRRKRKPTLHGTLSKVIIALIVIVLGIGSGWFERDYADATTILLEQNYRSTQTILSAANAVIARNPERKDKRLWTDAGDGDLIVGYVADNEHDEAAFVASEVDRLLDEVVADVELTGSAATLAAKLANGPTRAYGWIKASLHHGASHDLRSTLEFEDRAQGECFASPDHHEAIQAFVEKRPPRFS